MPTLALFAEADGDKHEHNVWQFFISREYRIIRYPCFIIYCNDVQDFLRTPATLICKACTSMITAKCIFGKNNFMQENSKSLNQTHCYHRNPRANSFGSSSLILFFPLCISEIILPYAFNKLICEWINELK